MDYRIFELMREFVKNNKFRNNDKVVTAVENLIDY